MMRIDYKFDYHPSFLDECRLMFKHCPNFDSDFNRFKKAINADLELYNHKLPKKYIKVPKRGHKIYHPVFKYRRFYCKKGDGSKLRFIFLLNRDEQLIFFY